jgi:formate-dependent nitrite reductase cytochrome c552 subunit
MYRWTSSGRSVECGCDCDCDDFACDDFAESRPHMRLASMLVERDMLITIIREHRHA